MNGQHVSRFLNLTDLILDRKHSMADMFLDAPYIQNCTRFGDNLAVHHLVFAPDICYASAATPVHVFAAMAKYRQDVPRVVPSCCLSLSLRHLDEDHDVSVQWRGFPKLFAVR
jgi:hypothetical protein